LPHIFKTIITPIAIGTNQKNNMSTQDFTTVIVVDQTPEQAFNAINNVRGWWSEEIEGSTNKLNDEFKYRFEDVHFCHIRLTEVVPNQKVVWHVLDNHFNFTEDEAEWTGTNMVFEITEKDGQTQVRLTHQGLVPEYECYEICKSGWTNYIRNSLYKLITTGKGEPNAAGTPRTEEERKLTSK
jgi:uncharacterized protein YndB with AHSA1/START domain